jgi:hypothetical protein
MSSHYNEDLEWIRTSEYTYSICDKLDNPNYAGTGECDVGLNRGNECAAYLQYIITQYDRLPARVAFVHGHEHAPHQQRSMSEALKCAETSSRMFQTLNGTVFRDEAWDNSIDMFITRNG